MKFLSIVFFPIITLLASVAGKAEENSTAPFRVTIDVSSPGTEVSPNRYGIFFEDINFAADGGLYAELIKNRSFEFPQAFMGWKIFGNVALQIEDRPFTRNPHYIRLSPASHRERKTGVENEGFRGIAWEKGKKYRFSAWGRVGVNQTTPVVLQACLIDEKNNSVAQTDMVITQKEWKKYIVELVPSKTVDQGSFRLLLNSPGIVDLDHLSLFPRHTWKERENGLRADLTGALKELNPGLLRFPGGCIVEGTSLATRYNWKDSIGPVENRPLNENRWNFSTKKRLSPDYYQSYGLGFYEYFLLAEDLGATPLPVLNCGMACQFQNGKEAHASLEDMDVYIQDALDLIEFANGDISTKWGALRAEMGHPRPFHLKYLAIGNEQWGDEYAERLERFLATLRKKHPEIRIIGSAGPGASGQEFDNLWKHMRSLNVDLVDEHYYASPDWFRKNARRYDTYPRSGPKVFAGEYACHTPEKSNNFSSALHEAAFMTGLERNADIVPMATYAPLLAHKDAWQWKPDLIWFDNRSLVLTPNYYVQQMYSTYAGNRILPLAGEDGKPLAGQKGLYGSSVFDGERKSIIVKLVNMNPSDCTIQLNFKGQDKQIPKGSGIAIRLHSDNIETQNNFEKPDNIRPVSTILPALEKNRLDLRIPAYSFGVYVFPAE